MATKHKNIINDQGKQLHLSALHFRTIPHRNAHSFNADAGLVQ